MKKLLIIASLAACFSLPAHAEVQTVDRIVTVVNKDIITSYDLNQGIQLAKLTLKHNGVAEPSHDILIRQVMDQLIRTTLLTQYAQSNGLDVSDAELDAAIVKIAEANQLSIDGLLAKVTSEGQTLQALKNDIRRQMIEDKIKDRLLSTRVSVSEFEIEQALKTYKDTRQPELNLATIVVQVPPAANAKQIDASVKKINLALSELKKGRSFASVVSKYSESTNAQQGGVLGWKALDELPPELASILNKLKVNEVSEVIRTPNAIYLFKVLDKREPSAANMISQSHVRHILIKTNAAVSIEEAKQKLVQIKDRILKGSSFEEQAKLYSEDGSAAQGGDLGWVSVGQMVPAFEKAYLSLKPNEISDFVVSEFGVHLIRVDGVRQQDIGSERRYMQVQNELKQRKLAVQYEDWYTQLKASAFIVDQLNEK